MSRNLPYDSGDPRRSPRDRSPGRRSDSRDRGRYNVGYGDPPQRSNSISRGPQNTFSRDDYRDGSRDLIRDFPPRDIPRGPKSYQDGREPMRDGNPRDIPSGPRAGNYQGDFRGRGGPRGRGRGFYEDRDRFQSDRDNYRDRRDERPYRDERSERGRYPDMRDRRDSGFRGGRRPSPPSAPSLYRGRGRATDDFRRFGRGRSRSPDPYDRAARRSSMVSPPPAVVDVPAFGAVTVERKVEADPSTTGPVPTGPAATIPASPAPAIPTGPRALAPPIAPKRHVHSQQWHSPTIIETPREPVMAAPKVPEPVTPKQVSGKGKILAQKRRMFVEPAASTAFISNPTSLQEELRQSIDQYEDSDSESEDEDDFGANYFEEELARVDGAIDVVLLQKRGLSTDMLASTEPERPKSPIAEEILPAADVAMQQSKIHTPLEPADSTMLTPAADDVQEQREEVDPKRQLAILSPHSATHTPLPTQEGSSVANTVTERSSTSAKNVPASTIVDTSPALKDSEPTVPARKKLVLITLPEYSDLDDESEAEYRAEVAASNTRIFKPVPLKFTSDVPGKGNFDSGLEDEDPEILSGVMQVMQDELDDQESEYERLAQEWKQGYRDWLLFHRSDEKIAVENRANWAHSAEARATPPARFTPLPESRPEGTRRTTSRFATEHDIERVLKESEREARENKEKTVREAQEAAAEAKEAKIPDMYSAREKDIHSFPDTSGLIPPERAALVFEAVPVDLKFSQLETEQFLRAIKDYPKRWTEIAAYLPDRSYKDCIQFYYQVKHIFGIRAMIAKRKKGRKAKKPKETKPKANALTATLRRDNDEDNADNADAEGEASGKPKSPRPKRAAAPQSFDRPGRSETEGATPAATPARRVRAKPDPNADPGPQKRGRKAGKTEKTAKQAKGGQSLTPAGPSRSASKTRVEEKRPKVATPVPQQISRILPPNASAFVNSWEPPQPAFQPPAPETYYHAPPIPAATTAPPAEIKHQPFTQEREMQPSNNSFEPMQTQRAQPAQTSSYWSVPESNDFPQLLAHFGTDWNGIAKHMQTKSLIMVKNYYQRQVESGKTGWQRIAEEADAKKSRGESTGIPPEPSMPTNVKRAPQRPSMGTFEEKSQGHIMMMQAGSSGPSPVGPRHPTPPLSQASRYPHLAQAGVVPGPMSRPPAEGMAPKHPASAQQNLQPQPRPQLQPGRSSQGPQMGSFAPNRDKAIIQSASHTPQPMQMTPSDLSRERSIMVAREAEVEKAQALRLEQQRIEDQQRRDHERLERHRQEELYVAQQKERQRVEQQRADQEHQARQHHLKLKQEAESHDLNRYEQYLTPAQHANHMPSARSQESTRYQEIPRQEPGTYRVEPAQFPYERDRYGRPSEPARPVQDFNARHVQSSRGPNDPMQAVAHPAATPPVARSSMSATTSRQDLTRPPPPPPAHSPALPAARQQDPVRKSNIMSLLNDEPTEPRQAPSKPATPLVRPLQSPAPQQNAYPPPARHSSGSGPSPYQAHAHHQQQSSQSSRYGGMPPQQQHQSPMVTHSQPQVQHQQIPSQHTYGQQPQAQHQMHPSQQQSGPPPPRSYTPLAYEQQGYAAPPPSSRREASLGDIHNPPPSHHRSNGSVSQSSMRLVESPYSAPSNALPAGPGRPQAASPHDRHVHAAETGRHPMDYNRGYPMGQQQQQQPPPQQAGLPQHQQQQQQQQHSYGYPPQQQPSYQAEQQQQRMYDEQRRMEEQRHMEEQRRIVESRRMEEANRLQPGYLSSQEQRRIHEANVQREMYERERIRREDEDYRRMDLDRRGGRR